MRRDLAEAEARVLGCLLEKQRTTPDAYPLTLNSLRLACNQATGRDPVVEYDEPTVRSAAERLARRRLARFASGHQSRAAKYRHLLREELGLADDELALLALLLLRGAQTPGELKARSERLHPFPALDAVHETLRRLAARELVASAGRRPGQKEERWTHRLSEDAEGPDEPAVGEPTPSGVDRLARTEPAPADRLRRTEPVPAGADRLARTEPAPSDAERLARIERELAELRDAVAALRSELGG